ncbi:MarR family transcriptional regulator [candidate division GN15 bacterium]|nr:MarR family transcriptional regulator [candidate division GN15 bacterium]
MFELLVAEAIGSATGFSFVPAIGIVGFFESKTLSSKHITGDSAERSSSQVTNSPQRGAQSGTDSSVPGGDKLPRDRYDLQVLSSLRRIIRAVDQYSHRLEREYRITVPQILCLSAIGQKDTITAKELAQAVHLSPSTVVGIVDRLEARSLVQRLRDSDDRRRVRISLTAEGRELLQRVPSPLQDRLAEGLSRLPGSEQATIAQSLARISDLMEAGHLSAAPILKTGEVQSPNPDVDAPPE